MDCCVICLKVIGEVYQYDGIRKMVREKRKMALFFKNLSGNIYDYEGCRGENWDIKMRVLLVIGGSKV